MKTPDGGVTAHFNFATDILDRWAAQRPGPMRALVRVRGNRELDRRYTFRELCGAELPGGESFPSLSASSAGDRVLVMLPRVPEWWVACWV